MKLQDTCVRKIFLFLNNTLKTNKTVSLDDIAAADECKRYSVSDIGKALELLRRNGFVKAHSQFGCSELLSFTATAITDAGKEYFQVQ